MSDSIDLRIIADGKEMTREQIDNITMLVYIDNDDEHADDLQIVLSESGFYGIRDLEVSIVDKNWQNRGKSAALKCGMFHVDDNKKSDTGGLYIVKAAATTYTSNIRQDARCQAWERINLKKLAGEIAERNGLKLVYATDFNPIFARKEQKFESDISFLSKLCRQMGLSLKFTDDSIVIYSKYEYSEESVRVFEKDDAEIRDDMMHHRKNDTAYGRCRVEYYDAVKKELITGEYVAAGNGRTLQIRQKVSSTEEAQRVAKYALYEKNSKEYTGYIECEGDISLAAGRFAELKGWGEFDRKYIIKKAIHTIQGADYTTKIFLEAAMLEE